MTFEEAFAELTKFGEHCSIDATHFQSGEVSYSGLLEVGGGVDNVQVHLADSLDEVVEKLRERRIEWLDTHVEKRISELKAELAKLEGEAA